LKTIQSLLIPFRNQPTPPTLPQGYGIESGDPPAATELQELLLACGDPPRKPERLQLALQRSIWHLAVRNPAGDLVGFVRATSDLALNANLWNLSGHPGDPHRDQVVLVLIATALTRLRRELPGCSISLSAPPEAVKALGQQGFVVDPGGIRAMGLGLS
jgi:hypothetical protein